MTKQTQDDYKKQVSDMAARMKRRREILERAAGVTDETIAIEFGGK